MNAGADQLTKSLIGKNSLSECSVAELQKLTGQYPYFSPAHFLLTQKLKEEYPSEFEKQFQKTSLFFQNPLWLEHLLANYVPNNTPLSETDEIPGEDQQIAETTFVEEKHDEPVETIELNNIKEEEHIEASEVEPEIVHEAVPTSPELVEEIYQEDEKELIVSEEIKPEIHEEQSEFEPEEPESQVELPQLKIKPFDTSTAKLTFEPYHTIDYFASQGVTFKEDDKPKDKFGQQLKSFTEWLKTMKKLPESEIIQPSIVSQDHKVEQLAEHSVAEREVVTETMADIWEKQGNHVKAIETYRKLSLLNPGKSSYFASKIEHLKQL